MVFGLGIQGVGIGSVGLFGWGVWLHELTCLSLRPFYGMWRCEV